MAKTGRPTSQERDPEQYDLAYSYYALHPELRRSPQAIHNRLVEVFGQHDQDAIRRGEHVRSAVSLRTVNTWLTKFRAMDVSLDEAFEWHNLDEYHSKGFGLNWDASEFLLPIWLLQMEKPNCEAPTIREMLWYWRVHLANPSWTHARVRFYSQRFIISERSCHSREKPLKGDGWFNRHWVRMALANFALGEREEMARLERLREKAPFEIASY